MKLSFWLVLSGQRDPSGHSLKLLITIQLGRLA
jgi:hypothetical protein